MRRTILLTVGLFFLITAGYAQQEEGVARQEDLSTFKNRARDDYYYIADPEIQNFTCLISSDKYIEFIRDKADSSFYYPLKFIWTRQGNAYYVLEALPELGDSLRKVGLTRAQALKNLWSGVIFDMQKFLIKSPLDEIPGDAHIKTSHDTVGISFRFSDDERTITSRETFTRGGRLARVTWIYADQKVINYPLYEEMEGKWLCVGWNSQVYEKGEIISGVAIRVIYGRYQEKYLPEQLNIMAQTRQEEEPKTITSTYVLFIKDFAFNEDLEIVPASADSAASGQEGG